MAGAPEELHVALLARGLHQPGVLVAFVEDILARIERCTRVLRVPKHCIFEDFRKISKVAESPPG